MRREKVSRNSRRQARRARLGRVLVVEDDPIIALAIDAALRDAGATEGGA
jgi:hypothetical protein